MTHSAPAVPPRRACTTSREPARRVPCSAARASLSRASSSATFRASRVAWAASSSRRSTLADLYSPDPFRASDHDPVLIGLFPDADRDGFTDARDACPHSILADTVVLGGCDSGVPESLDPGGCTTADGLLAVAETARQRGELASEANRWLAQRIDGGILERRDRGALLACFVRSRPGWSPVGVRRDTNSLDAPRSSRSNKNPRNPRHLRSGTRRAAEWRGAPRHRREWGAGYAAWQQR